MPRSSRSYTVTCSRATAPIACSTPTSTCVAFSRRDVRAGPGADDLLEVGKLLVDAGAPRGRPSTATAPLHLQPGRRRRLPGEAPAIDADARQHRQRRRGRPAQRSVGAGARGAGGVVVDFAERRCGHRTLPPPRFAEHVDLAAGLDRERRTPAAGARRHEPSAAARGRNRAPRRRWSRCGTGSARRAGRHSPHPWRRRAATSRSPPSTRCSQDTNRWHPPRRRAPSGASGRRGRSAPPAART